MKQLLLSALLCLPCVAQITTTTDLGPSGANTRALTTIYHNTTGHPILVAVTVGLNQCSFAGCTANLTANILTDTAATPTTITQTSQMSSNAFGAQDTPVYAMVPVNSYYEVTASRTFTVSDPGSPFVVLWIESQFTDGTSGTQSVVTGSRALDGTVYQNTGSGLLWVSIVSNPAGATTTYTATVDSSASPTTVIQTSSCAVGFACDLFFPVLPNYYYKVTQNQSATLTSWTETRTPSITATQNVVTGSRAVGFGGTYTTYSSGSNAIFESVSVATSGSSANNSTISKVDTGTPATANAVASSKHASEINVMFSAIPPSYFYAETNDIAGATLQQWVEWNVGPVATQTRNHAYVF